MQRVLPELGRVSPSALRVPPESFSYSAVTNNLIRGYQLVRIFSLEMGLKIRRNLKFDKILFKKGDRTRSSRKLRNKYFFSPTKLVVLTFGDLNNHEYLVTEKAIPSYPEDIVELMSNSFHLQ